MKPLPEMWKIRTPTDKQLRLCGGNSHTAASALPEVHEAHF